ncbi:hypothetical protein KL905_000033 [Ogataea polymorpha]|nr:hypothetical protein KL937_001045 [Ogataea polymorpha]KAG7902722.1 hypothetical protein KL935_001630 [Ogataea polymorpha]KAG7912878.1 hypothetical protein KL907_001080 [Ogataea polymorpha]KAG7923879.1 hypothetical protein KL905_000033 [Ogataea polymorpha]KAG7936951.1 hypothetical protein KL934_001154 [Ogataea polymorpha]
MAASVYLPVNTSQCTNLPLRDLYHVQAFAEVGHPHANMYAERRWLLSCLQISSSPPPNTRERPTALRVPYNPDISGPVHGCPTARLGSCSGVALARLLAERDPCDIQTELKWVWKRGRMWTPVSNWAGSAPVPPSFPCKPIVSRYYLSDYHISQNRNKYWRTNS